MGGTCVKPREGEEGLEGNLLRSLLRNRGKVVVVVEGVDLGEALRKSPMVGEGDMVVVVDVEG